MTFKAKLGVLVALASVVAAHASEKVKTPAKAKHSRQPSGAPEEVVLTEEEKEIVRQARLEFEASKNAAKASKRLHDRMQDEMNTSAVMGGAQAAAVREVTEDREAIENLLPHLTPRALRVLRHVGEKLPRAD